MGAARTLTLGQRDGAGQDPVNDDVSNGGFQAQCGPTGEVLAGRTTLLSRLPRSTVSPLHAEALEISMMYSVVLRCWVKSSIMKYGITT